MVSPLSPMFSIYFKFFEELNLHSALLQLSIWLQYVDDTLILWLPSRKHKVLLYHVISIRPDDEEQQISLCLDVLVNHTKKEMALLGTNKSTYRVIFKV